jgi:hypothetical protein
MVSGCANPECAASFDYRQGRYFRFSLSPAEGESPANTHSVRHFWLCRDCVGTYTLERRGDSGVLIRHRFKLLLDVRVPRPIVAVI